MEDGHQVSQRVKTTSFVLKQHLWRHIQLPSLSMLFISLLAQPKPNPNQQNWFYTTVIFAPYRVSWKIWIWIRCSWIDRRRWRNRWVKDIGHNGLGQMLRNPDLSSALLIVVFVPNLLDHFTPIVIIVTVSALTISLAAIISEYLVAVQVLSGVQRVCAATTNAKTHSYPLVLGHDLVGLFLFFFSLAAILLVRRHMHRQQQG